MLARRTPGRVARVLLFLISASSLLSSGAKVVTMPEDLETFELHWQPWKLWNYSSPGATKYCKDAYCLRFNARVCPSPTLSPPLRRALFLRFVRGVVSACLHARVDSGQQLDPFPSASLTPRLLILPRAARRCSQPEDFTRHPYQSCRNQWSTSTMVTLNNTKLTHTSYATIEVASSLYDFDSLLVCFAQDGISLRSALLPSSPLARPLTGRKMVFSTLPCLAGPSPHTSPSLPPSSNRQPRTLPPISSRSWPLPLTHCSSPTAHLPVLT